MVSNWDNLYLHWRLWNKVLKCISFIRLDGCILKEYYGGTILADVGRDSNDQMLSVAISTTEE
jgi:hypothetical protein